MKEHLIHYFPFLNKEFRKLSDDELQSEETFKELFPDEPIELHKLRAIATFQRLEETYILVSSDTPNVKIEVKTKRNAKV